MITLQSTLEEVMLAEPGRRWELHRGQLLEKPPMSESHNVVALRLEHQILFQIDRVRFEVRPGIGRVRTGDRTYYIPDVFVIELSAPRTLDSASTGLEVISAALPFVAEVWSPSTCDYDVDRKLPEYQARGDAEIWRVHPFDRTVTMWRLQPDGGYAESLITAGHVTLHALPHVTVDIDALFA